MSKLRGLPTDIWENVMMRLDNPEHICDLSILLWNNDIQFRFPRVWHVIFQKIYFREIHPDNRSVVFCDDLDYLDWWKATLILLKGIITFKAYCYMCGKDVTIKSIGLPEFCSECGRRKLKKASIRLMQQ